MAAKRFFPFEGKKKTRQLISFRDDELRTGGDFAG